VAKREVQSWPVFGWFASLAGTIFVRRERRSQTGRAISEIQSALDGGALVALFPEGTSSSGDTVLPFKSALLEPATDPRHPLAACGLGFEIEDGRVADEVCYWRDMTLVPHLLNLLGKRGVSAFVSFSRIQERAGDRKQLAQQLHAEVRRLAAKRGGAQFNDRQRQSTAGSLQNLPAPG
jgi:1-acyl-sn-glycerol-3-phosphate acyltransferase